MVSFWPDALWTPEFTDLATVSPSPHRHLDGMAVAAAAAVLTTTVPLATSVVDTVRRHPAQLAQGALTVDHLSRGRFILGLGSGETENIVPYGFEFAKPVSRFEEALKVIRLLWDSPGPVDFDGQFYRSGSVPADRGCSRLSAALPTAGGRPVRGPPSTTRRCSVLCANRPYAPDVTRWRSPRALCRCA
jgi:hypothetical protein